jgi:hypothetical protein
MVAPIAAQQVVTTPTTTVTSPYNGSGDPVNASRFTTVSSAGETRAQAWDGNTRTLTQVAPGQSAQVGLVRTDIQSGATQTTTRPYDDSELLVSIVGPSQSSTFSYDGAGTARGW